MAKNRHTLTPSGWVHEQDNYKLVIEGDERSVIAREVGLNVYQRTTSVDFSKVRSYWAGTSEFWGDVRSSWADLMSAGGAGKLGASGKDKKLYQHMFGLAAEALKHPEDREGRKKKIREVMNAFVLGDGPTSGSQAPY